MSDRDISSRHLSEDLEPLLLAAKINIPNLLPEVQCLAFAAEYGAQDTMLMEITEELLCQLESGSTFTIRGMTEDFAVLCTDDRTFELKLREVSNVMLVSPDVKTADLMDGECARHVAQKQIDCMHSGYLELRPLVSRCGRAKHLLEEAPFSGFDYELETATCRKYSREELLDIVQSSRVELDHYLTSVIFSCEIDGKIRLLTHDYVTRLMERMKSWLEECSLPWDAIPVGLAASALLDLEPESVMRDFFWPRFSMRIGDTISLRREPIARVYAATFLKRGEKINVENFVLWFRTTIPFLDFDDSLLHGLAYNEVKETISSFVSYPAEDLPSDPEQRCRQLFTERAKWPKQELLPYILDVLLPGESPDRLLLKYAKSYVSDGIAYYISSSQF